MPSMSDAYLNAIADHGASQMTHLALIDSDDNDIERIELDGEAGRPEWTDAGDGEDDPGTIRLSADYEFSITGGTTVKGWRAYDQAAAEGQTEWGGADLDTSETFANDGTFKLLAAETAVHHSVPE